MRTPLKVSHSSDRDTGSATMATEMIQPRGLIASVMGVQGGACLVAQGGVCAAHFELAAPAKPPPAGLSADRLPAGDVRKLHCAPESAYGDGLNYFRNLAKAMAPMMPMMTRPRTPGAGNAPLVSHTAEKWQTARAGPALIVAAPTARTAAVMVFRNMLIPPVYLFRIYNCTKSHTNS